MAKKRKSMKGKGADIFLGADEEEKTGNQNESDSEVSTKKNSSQDEGKNSDMEEKKNPTLSISTDGEKEKAGFYLDKALIDELELVWVKTRNLTGNKVSKSDIVNLSLKSMIEDFKQKPEKSKLVKNLS